MGDRASVARGGGRAMRESGGLRDATVRIGMPGHASADGGLGVGGPAPGAGAPPESHGAGAPDLAFRRSMAASLVWRGPGVLRPSAT